MDKYSGYELEYCGTGKFPNKQTIPDDMRNFILYQVSEKEQIKLMRDIMEVLVKKAKK